MTTYNVTATGTLTMEEVLFFQRLLPSQSASSGFNIADSYLTKDKGSNSYMSVCRN